MLVEKYGLAEIILFIFEIARVNHHAHMLEHVGSQHRRVRAAEGFSLPSRTTKLFIAITALEIARPRLLEAPIGNRKIIQIRFKRTRITSATLHRCGSGANPNGLAMTMLAQATRRAPAPHLTPARNSLTQPHASLQRRHDKPSTKQAARTVRPLRGRQSFDTLTRAIGSKSPKGLSG